MWNILAVLAHGIVQTVQITLSALLVSAVLGLPLAILRRSAPRPVRLLTAAAIELFRAIPPVVWLFIMFDAVSSGSVKLSTYQAAVAGLGLVYAAHLAEVYRAGLDSVPSGQWDAVRALALPRRSAYTQVVLPQAFAVVIPPMATFAIALLKDSATASIIGASDITFQAVQLTQDDLNGLGNFAVAGLLYILLSIPLAVVARGTDKALSRRLAVS